MKAPREIPANIGDVIAERRIRAKMSRAELAAKAGIGTATLHKTETGKSTPKIDTLTFIANALDSTIGKLCGAANRKLKKAAA